jgi:hypothetical protein
VLADALNGLTDGAFDGFEGHGELLLAEYCHIENVSYNHMHKTLNVMIASV